MAKCGGESLWRILIECVSSSIDGSIREKQCGFREGRGCVDKYLGLNKVVYRAFMDLEKAYDRP